MTQTHDTRVVNAYEPAASQRPSATALRLAAYWLERGVPVVVPTETVYGLAAPALDREAVSAIFRIKGRPLDNPLIAHVTELGQLEALGAELSPLAARLVDEFWPGPLTLVLRAKRRLPWVTAGLDSIAVRQPAHAFARALIHETGPLAAPSANLSGLPSPTRAAHAVADLAGRVPLIVDGGDLEHGVESTVIDARGATPVLLRPGALDIEALSSVAGAELPPPPGPAAVARSPGMKYRHYSPRAQVWVYPPASDANSLTARRLARDAATLMADGLRVGVIARHSVRAHHFVHLPNESSVVAQRLFAWLRELDGQGAERVLIEGVMPTGIGRAVMDRLQRAATRLITVELEDTCEVTA